MFSFTLLGVLLVIGSAVGIQICGSPNGFFQDGNSCDSYFECRDLHAERKSCSNGLYFNPNAVWPHYPCDYTPPPNCDSGSLNILPPWNILDQSLLKLTINNTAIDQKYWFLINARSPAVPPTQPPVTYTPTTLASRPPATVAPPTQPPVTYAPTTKVTWPLRTAPPATQSPVTNAPTAIPTWPPTTAAPPPQPPITYAPTTLATWPPRTAPPATQPPVTYAPPTVATWPPTTAAPATQPPVTALSTYWPTAAPNTAATYVPTQPSATIAPGTIQGYNCQQPNGYFSVADKCDEYVKCQDNVAVGQTCPDGLHFNPQRKYPEYPCDYPILVKCSAGQVAQPPVAKNQCPNLNGLFPMSNGDCSKYMVCEDGVSRIMPCPAGLVFNTKIDDCDWPINVPSCNLDSTVFKGFSCPAQTDSDLIEKFRYKDSCTYYVACQRGYPRYLSCDIGLRYDETTQSCIDASKVTNCTA